MTVMGLVITSMFRVVVGLIFRTAQCFQSDTEHEHSTVNAVAAPGQRAALGIKRHHDPDAEPENGGDDKDLAKQEDSVKAFRPLREHV